MPNTMTLTVNDKSHVIASDPETPLLYVLRNELGLVGTRFGCGMGICGACMVIIGSRAVRSCALPVSMVMAPVTTVEGLAGAHPVQRALVAEQAGQCGFCLTGIAMSAKALLDATPRPSEAEIRRALDGNICRCGSQPRVLRAIERAVAGAAS